MESQNPTPNTLPAPPSTTTTTQPIEPPPPAAAPQLSQQQQKQPPAVSQPLPSSTTPPSANPNPKPNPPLKPPTQPQSQAYTTASAAASARPQTLHRPWQHPHPHSHFAHFSSITSPSSSTSSPPVSAPQQRGTSGGVAIGVPASHPSPSPVPPFSSSFGQSQVRQGIPGVQGMAMVGSMSSGSQLRPGGIGIPAHHQQRPVQSSVRPTSSSSSPNNQTPTNQSFQGHSFMRPSSVSPGSPATNTSQSMQSPSQPWLSSGAPGKPPLPSSSYRPQLNSPSLQQRSHIPQQHHSLPTTSQQQHISSVQLQKPLPSQPPEHYGQQFPSRVPRSITQQLALQGALNPKPSSLAMVQPNPVQVGTQNQNKTVKVEGDDSGNRILSKRSINELVSQIDPFEKLDPEVEDILVDIADEFVDSITTFACSLAKHRKSETLEAKDILLHLERNWNMTLPGFSGDEIKTYRKPVASDIHKERLAAIKKSVLASEMSSVKHPVGQATGNAKSNLTKTPANAMVSPNLKIREVT